MSNGSARTTAIDEGRFNVDNQLTLSIRAADCLEIECRAVPFPENAMFLVWSTIGTLFAIGLGFLAVWLCLNAGKAIEAQVPRNKLAEVGLIVVLGAGCCLICVVTCRLAEHMVGLRVTIERGNGVAKVRYRLGGIVPIGIRTVALPLGLIVEPTSQSGMYGLQLTLADPRGRRGRASFPIRIGTRRDVRDYCRRLAAWRWPSFISTSTREFREANDDV